MGQEHKLLRYHPNCGQSARLFRPVNAGNAAAPRRSSSGAAQTARTEGLSAVGPSSLQRASRFFFPSKPFAIVKIIPPE